MKRYEFSDAERKALEKLRVPLAVYQFLNKRVVTVLVSDGFIEMLGYDSREKTIYARMPTPTTSHMSPKRR